MTATLGNTHGIKGINGIIERGRERNDICIVGKGWKKRE